MKNSEEMTLGQRSAGMNYRTPGLLCVLWKSSALSGLRIPPCVRSGGVAELSPKTEMLPRV